MAEADLYCTEPAFTQKCVVIWGLFAHGQGRAGEGTPYADADACLGYRFKPSRAKEVIAGVLKTRLTGAVYHADNTSSWAREIADDIKQKLKGKSRLCRPSCR